MMEVVSELLFFIMTGGHILILVLAANMLSLPATILCDLLDAGTRVLTLNHLLIVSFIKMVHHSCIKVQHADATPWQYTIPRHKLTSDRHHCSVPIV
jgi:hypothetical protein